MDETRLNDELAPIIESYQALETKLLESIASHLPFDDPGGGSFEWYAKKLLELGGINRKNMQMIATMAKTTLPQVQKAFAEIGYAAVIADDEVYNIAFEKGFLPNKPESAYLSPALRNIFLTSFALAEDKLNLTNTKAPESANSAFLNAVNSCYIEVSSGAYDYNTALRRALTTLADEGIRGATYMRKDGTKVNYPLDATVRRNLMTASNNTAVEMQFQRGDEWGSDLIEISSHMGARPLCEPFQGRIFDRSGKHPVYPDFYKDTSYGEPAGIFGINCGHVPYPFIEGLSEQSFFPYPKEDNDEAYKHSQEQRRLEMNVRRYKQRIAVAKAGGHTDMYDINAPKLKEAERKLKDFLADSPNAQQPRVGVAKFSHSEAMTAVWAERKALQGAGNGGIIGSGGGRMNITGASGAIPRNDFDRLSKHAQLYYEEVRNRSGDVESIAKNTGFSVEDVQKIKEHVFLNYYDLDEKEPTRFHPDYDMAVSWQRLTDGKSIQEMDIVLLKHELMEYNIMKTEGVKYREAHEITEKVHNYKAYLIELDRRFANERVKTERDE